LSKGWNFLGTILLNNSFRIDKITDNLFQLPSKVKKALMILALSGMAIFAVIHWDLFLMSIAIALLPTLIAVIGLISVYFIGALLFNIRRLIKENLFHIFNRETIRYFMNISAAVSRAILPSFLFIFTVFMLLSVSPKPFRYNNSNIVKSLTDKENDVLYVDRSQEGDYCIPLQYSEIPSFLLRCITNQEDKNFNSQDDGRFNSSNWHGISPAFLLRSRGGSNINMQLVKNMSFQGTFPQDLSRKIAELLASYQLSISQDKKDIMSWYVNTVGFHGATGFIGLEAASLYAFGKTINQLNSLEQLYLVATLPINNYFMKSNGIEITYPMVGDYKEEIKERLIQKATRWYESDLLTRQELNLLKRDSLRFTNQNYQSGIATSSRLFFEKQLQSYPEAKYVGSVTKTNQQRLQAAYTEYGKNRYFPPVLQKDGYTLYTAALVIDYKTGDILGHFSNHTEDLTSFGDGFSMASLIKPFILLQMLEEGMQPIRLYDGIIQGKKTPLNAELAYTNKYVGVQTILSKSLNAPMVNIREVCSPLPLFQKVEDKFEVLGITSQKELCNDTYNYPMGSRLITLWEIAQAYQCLFNNGANIELTAVSGVFNPKSNKVELLPSKAAQQIYQSQNTDIIKEALSYTLIDGTATALKNILPDGQQFYIKTGTSNDGANHGYCVLADDDILIVSWMSYGKIVNGRLQLNGTPPIPYNTGGKSAGVFAS
jgi:membrane peptidoglycan carboxypeptidase